MQLVSATLAEVRQALEDAYAVRQFGTGGNMAKLNVNTYLDICNTVVESFDESRFVFNADVFLPPTDTAVKIRPITKFSCSVACRPKSGNTSHWVATATP